MPERGAQPYPQGPSPRPRGPSPPPRGPSPPPRGLGPQALDRLLSVEGQALLRLLPEGPLDPTDGLRLGTRLRERFPAELVAAALAQHGLRVRAAAKFTKAEWTSLGGTAVATRLRKTLIYHPVGSRPFAEGSLLRT